jgi:hypothetical protein
MFWEEDCSRGGGEELFWGRDCSGRGEILWELGMICRERMFWVVFWVVFWV